MRCVIHLQCWIFCSLQKGNSTSFPLTGDEERIKRINEEKTFRPSGGSGIAPPPLQHTLGFLSAMLEEFSKMIWRCVWRGKFGHYTVTYIMLLLFN